jgi:hydroxyacylglutathione hydrolase
MPAQAHQFLCLQDNYGVLLHDPATGATAAIDAPEAAAVERALQQTGWRLTDILVTHHHGDHTAGIPDLKRRYSCRVVAPRAEASRIADVDVHVAEGDEVKVGELVGRVLDTPGHTRGHVSYSFKRERLAFVGDTLFSIGCGRLLEGTPEMMWRSLEKLRRLADDTAIYCGHEYTASNVAYACSIDPDNAALKARADEVTRMRERGEPTLPTRMNVEKAANPFLRADAPELAKRLGMDNASPVEVFANIRSGKDNFRG